MSTPNSLIVICSGVPLNNTYEHTLYFDSAAAQAIYFTGRMAAQFANYSFLRPERKIKVVGDFAAAYTWNYLYFQNADNKRFYHFINRVEYINDNTVELEIELDVIQTFMFDWQLHGCMVERTHTLTDNFGEHTVPEGLDPGPLVQYSAYDISLKDCYIMVMMTTSAGGGRVWGNMYGGVYSGLATYAVNPAKLAKFNTYLKALEDDGAIDSIVNMWMYPKTLVRFGDGVTIDDDDPNHYMAEVYSVGAMEVEVPDPFYAASGGATVGSGYVRNLKAAAYPYTMVYITNNMGGSATLRREYFNNTRTVTDKSKLHFKVCGALSPESGVSLVPQYYHTEQGRVENFEESLSLAAFPSCAWNSDVYKVWLAQNMASQDAAIRHAKENAILSGIGGAIGVIGGAASGNAMAAVGGGAAIYHSITNARQTIESILAQREDMSVQPPQARGHHSASVNMTHNVMGFGIHFMCAPPEHLQRIDDYFTRYGYKVNRFEEHPSIYNRSRYTYIKTAGSYITGGFGADHQRKIQTIFDNGITFWADVDNVGDYDRNDLL